MAGILDAISSYFSPKEESQNTQVQLSPQLAQAMQFQPNPQSTQIVPEPISRKPSSINSTKTTTKVEKKSPMETKKKTGDSTQMKKAKESYAALPEGVKSQAAVINKQLANMGPMSYEQMLQGAPEKISAESELIGKAVSKMPAGSNIRQTIFDQVIPSPTQFGKMLRQAGTLRRFANPQFEESMATNAEMLANAKKLFEEKMAKPYRNVNLERLDKLTAALAGSRPLGMENEPGPEQNLALMSNMAKLKQMYELQQQKEYGDYVQGITKPVQVGQVNAAHLAPPKGKEPKEVRESIIKHTDAGKNAVLTQSYVDQMAELLKAPWSLANFSKFETLRLNIVNRVKELEKYGANFSGVEQQLAQANIPENYFTAKLLGSKNLYNKSETLKAYSAFLKEKTKSEKEFLKTIFKRPGEEAALDAAFGGAASVAEEGRLFQKENKDSGSLPVLPNKPLPPIQGTPAEPIRKKYKGKTYELIPNSNRKDPNSWRIVD